MTALAVAFAVKASAVLGLALLAVAGLKRRSAAARHWVLSASVLSVCALPVAMATVPTWSPAFVSLPGEAGAVAHVPTGAVTTNMDVRLPGPSAGLPVRGPLSTGYVSMMQVLIWLWALGLSAALLVLAAGFGRLRALTRHATTVTDGEWRLAADRIGSEYGLRHPVRLIRGRSSAALVAWGWWRQTVLLPAGAETWPADRVGVVLSHELGHLARHDWPVQLAAEVMRGVLWFNPLAWLTCQWLRRDSEHACDDMVLARGYAADAYATHLLEVARGLRSTSEPWLPAPAMARSSSLEGRVEAMLNHTQDRTRSSLLVRFGAPAILVAVAASVAGLQAQGPYYTLTGSVTDQTDGQLAGVVLVLTNPADQSKHEVRTDTAGRFEFAGLRRAGYVLDVQRPGFSSFREEVQLSGNAERKLRLKVGSLLETITVTSRTVPAPVLGPAEQQKREEARQRFAEKRQQFQAQCEAGAVEPGTIVPPAKVQDARPEYPEHLKASGVGGAVTMRALIGTDGAIRDVRDVQGPHPDLEAAAARAVAQWRFTPTTLNCQPIEVEMRVVTNFAPAQ